MGYNIENDGEDKQTVEGQKTQINPMKIDGFCLSVEKRHVVTSTNAKNKGRSYRVSPLDFDKFKNQDFVPSLLFYWAFFAPIFEIRVPNPDGGF